MDLNELLSRHQLAVMNAPVAGEARRDLINDYVERIGAFRKSRGLCPYRWVRNAANNGARSTSRT